MAETTTLTKAIPWVAQEDEDGGLHAALAMVTGQSYADIRARFPSGGERDLDRALTVIYLVTNGRKVTDRLAPPGSSLARWQPQPWCTVHICEVVDSNKDSAHAVVLLNDGTVLDSSRPGTYTLKDYKAVLWIIGIEEMPIKPRRTSAGRRRVPSEPSLVWPNEKCPA